MSINGSKIDTKPSSIECFVLDVACAIGEEPWPASLEYNPLATPYVNAVENEAPKNPPAIALPLKTSWIIM